MNIYYLFTATFLIISFFVSHFFALKNCVAADWWRVLFAFLGLFAVMLLVGVLPIFDLETINSTQDYSSAFLRSVIEEISKIVACYVVFEMLSEKRIKLSTLAFCSLVALYESSMPIAYIITGLTQGYISLLSDAQSGHYVVLDQMKSSLHIAELTIFTGSEILRIFTHFYLTYAGVCFLHLKGERWLVIVPLCAHGLLNQFVLYLSTNIESNGLSILLKCLLSLLAMAILSVLLRHKLYGRKLEMKMAGMP